MKTTKSKLLTVIAIATAEQAVDVATTAAAVQAVTL